MRITTYKLKQIIEEELASQIKIVTDETGAEETETIGPQTKVTTDKSGNISTRSPYDNAPTTVLGDIGVGWDGDKETFKSTQLMTVGSEDELQNMPRKVHGTTSTGKAFTGVKEAPGLGWRTAESLHRSQMYMPQVTGSTLRQLIEEELQNMLFEADCPEGMTAQGNQCVGTAKPQEDPEVFTVAEPNPTEAPTSDASSWEINQAITAKGRAKAEARPPPKPVDRDVGWDSAIDKLGGSLAAMGATKV